MKHRPNRRLDDILRQAPGIAGILARLANNRSAAEALYATCRQMVPGLDIYRPGTCDLRDGTLRLNCQSAAQANKLRQATPRLLLDLQRMNLDVNEIKLSVQPTTVPETGVGHTVRSANSTAHRNPSKSGGLINSNLNALKLRDFSAKLQNRLEPGDLQNAVERLWRSASRQARAQSTSEQTRDEQNREEGQTSREPGNK